jgi:carboxypeptidase C (cathepsin A)
MPILAVLLIAVATAQTPPAPAPNPALELTTSVTHHSLPSGAAYTATAEQIPIRSEAGDIECRMFAVTYAKDGAAPKSRPVTFVFNGGPGSASLWLHLGAVGPKRAPMPDDGSLPAPPYEAVDNPDTWLDFTDVVVIDAPATGYSRISKPEFKSKYFGVRPDIQAFTNFIKGWLAEHNRWNSPLFVGGESYGGIRGSGLSDSLFGEGINLSGFISISGSSNFLTLDGMRGNDYTYMGFLPSEAACAWYHHKLGPRFTSPDMVVKETQQWIDKEYASALERGDSLSPSEKEHIASKMSEYLGISKKYCFDSNLRVPEFAFFRELLRDDNLTIGRYDGRLVGKEEKKVGDFGDGDPSDDATSGAFTMSIRGYLAKDLAIKTTMPYNTGADVGPWPSGDGSYPETSSDLRHVLTRNPHFHVLYCCGYYDLACPLNATVYTVNHMGLDAETRSRVSFQFFPAGHMMYIEKSSRKKLHDDVAAFEKMCLASG